MSVTWSLQVSNGDLVLGGARLATVIGEAKLAQDFRHYLLEHMGDDPLHRSYGSLFDGGVRSNGIVVDSVIGEVNGPFVSAVIDEDIRRLATDYQSAQLVRARDDKLRYGKTTLTANEILASISAITLVQQEDTLNIIIKIITAANTTFEIRTNLKGILVT